MRLTKQMKSNLFNIIMNKLTPPTLDEKTYTATLKKEIEAAVPEELYTIEDKFINTIKSRLSKDSPIKLKELERDLKFPVEGYIQYSYNHPNIFDTTIASYQVIQRYTLNSTVVTTLFAEYIRSLYEATYGFVLLKDISTHELSDEQWKTLSEEELAVKLFFARRLHVYFKSINMEHLKNTPNFKIPESVLIVTRFLKKHHEFLDVLHNLAMTISSCNTDKQLKDMYPEFEQYFEKAGISTKPPTPKLPAIYNLPDELKNYGFKSVTVQSIEDDIRENQLDEGTNSATEELE